MIIPFSRRPAARPACPAPARRSGVRSAGPRRPLAALVALSPLLAGPALAHVTLEPPQAAAGSDTSAALRVGHGCAGAATRTIRVTMPEGVAAAAPLPKPGWTVAAVPAEGAPRVGALVWTGTLPDDRRGEFAFRLRLEDGLPPGAMLYFPAVQDCGEARADWGEIPAAGQDPHDLKAPAPALRILAAGETGGGAAGTAGHDHGAAGPSGHRAVPEVRLGNLALSGGFARATPPKAQVAGGFLVIVNSGATADRLLGATSPVAGAVQIHEMRAVGDLMTMRHLPQGVEVPAGGRVTLAPAGLHLMMLGLKGPLAEGETVPVTLRFERAGEVTVPLAVLSATAAAGPEAHPH